MANEIWASDAAYPAGPEPWATEPTKVAPDAAEIAAGHAPALPVPAEVENWWKNRADTRILAAEAQLAVDDTRLDAHETRLDTAEALLIDHEARLDGGKYTDEQETDVPASAFQRTVNIGVMATDQWGGAGAGMTVVAPIILPVGSTLTKVVLSFTRPTGVGLCRCELWRRNRSGAASVIMATQDSIATGPDTIEHVVNHVALAATMYSLVFTIDGAADADGAALYGGAYFHKRL